MSSCSFYVMIAFGAFCLSGTVVSARGAFASPEKLLSMSKLIGTKNPVVARITCFVGLVVCTVAGAGTIILAVLDLIISSAPK
jgi:hypothetical protein